jgi:hypothetical protein
MKIFILIVLTIIITAYNLLPQNLLWEKVYNSPLGLIFSEVVEIKESKDNNFYVISYLSDTLPGRYIPAIMKISPFGEILWSFHQINEKCIYPRFITENNDNLNLFGIRVRSFGFDEAGFTPYKYKFDSSNSLISESFETEVKGSILDNKGTILLTKDSLLLNISYRKNNILIKEYDVNANYIRDIRLDTTKIKYIPFMAFQDTDSNIYLLGQFTYSQDNKNFILKLDKDYKKIWLIEDTLESDNSYLFGVEYLPNNNFVITGRTQSRYIADSAKARLYIKVYNSDGELIVNKQYPSSRYRYVYDIKSNKNGCFIIAGDSGIYSYSKKYFNLIKTDSLGVIIWEKTWGDNSVMNYLRASLITKNNLIYVVGRRDSLMYIACLKDEPVGINEEYKNLISCSSVFPNPAKDFINIELENKRAENITIELYDNTGRQIKILFNDALPPGMFNLALPLPDIASDCYNIIINYGNKYKESKKIVIY